MKGLMFIGGQEASTNSKQGQGGRHRSESSRAYVKASASLTLNYRGRVMTDDDVIRFARRGLEEREAARVCGDAQDLPSDRCSLIVTMLWLRPIAR